MNEPLGKKPTSLELRDMLEEMAIKDLLGPASGPEEEVDETNVRDRYLVGTLAPRRPSPLHDAEMAPSQPSDDDGMDGDFPANDELAIGGDGSGVTSGDDGPVELAAPQSKAIFPSSLGMSFCLDLEAKELQVTASWGRYDKQPSEHLVNEKTGSPRMVWKREPCGGQSHTIPVAEGSIGAIEADAHWPEVVIKGVIRKRSIICVIPSCWLLGCVWRGVYTHASRPPRGTEFRHCLLLGRLLHFCL